MNEPKDEPQKSCPFCGATEGKLMVLNSALDTLVKCQRCKATGPTVDIHARSSTVGSREAAIVEWNRRV